MLEKTIIVHHLNDSRSQRVLWLLEELEVPYEIKQYQRQPDMAAPKEMLEINPLGKSPAITDEDVVLSESGAIVGLSLSALLFYCFLLPPSYSRAARTSRRIKI